MALHLLKSDHGFSPEDFDLETPSGCSCAVCGEGLALREEIFLVEIMYATLSNGEIQCFNILDDEGDLEYDPLYFQWGCWEQLLDELHEFTENRPPVLDQAVSILRCNQCGSGIRAMEKFGRVRCGEMHPAPRQPNNSQIALEFVDIGSEDAICISCLYHVNTECLDLWGQGVTQNGACEEGVHARCWRWGTCPCPHRTE